MAEQEAHVILAPCRVAAKREFFRTSPSSAIDAVKEALLKATGIAVWESDEPHEIKHGDRIALTMEAGDLFRGSVLSRLSRSDGPTRPAD